MTINSFNRGNSLSRIGRNVTSVINKTTASSGGTKTTSGSYAIHTFTGSTTLSLTFPAIPSISYAPSTNKVLKTTSLTALSVEYLIVGGGAGGQSGHERGGAGGQVITGTLVNVSAPISVTVGGGGPASSPGPNGAGNAGSPSSFGPISTSSAPSGGPGPAPNNASAGSGGIGAPGTNGSRAGGNGVQSSISGTNLYYGGGGGGAGGSGFETSTGGNGGYGGGGGGGTGPGGPGGRPGNQNETYGSNTPSGGSAAAANTGGGGGSGGIGWCGTTYCGGNAGGSGIIIAKFLQS